MYTHLTLYVIIIQNKGIVVRMGKNRVTLRLDPFRGLVDATVMVYVKRGNEAYKLIYEKFLLKCALKLFLYWFYDLDVVKHEYNNTTIICTTTVCSSTEDR